MSEVEETLKLEDIVPKRWMVELPDGSTTPMLDPKELSLYDRARVGRMAQQVIDLNEETLQKPASQDRAARLEKTLREFAAMVLPEASEDLIANLAPYHLDQVTGAFLGRYGDMTINVAKRIQDRLPTSAG